MLGALMAQSKRGLGHPAITMLIEEVAGVVVKSAITDLSRQGRHMFLVRQSLLPRVILELVAVDAARVLRKVVSRDRNDLEIFTALQA